MAETIVEDFEFVNINEQHGKSEIRVPTRLSNRALQPVEKKRAVRKIGQAVVEGQMVQFFLGPLPLGNVAVHDDQPFGLAFRAANSVGGRLNEAPRTIFMADPIFESLTPARVAS